MFRDQIASLNSGEQKWVWEVVRSLVSRFLKKPGGQEVREVHGALLLLAISSGFVISTVFFRLQITHKTTDALQIFSRADMVRVQPPQEPKGYSKA